MDSSVKMEEKDTETQIGESYLGGENEESTLLGTSRSLLADPATTVASSVDLGTIESNRRTAEALIMDEDSEGGGDGSDHEILNMTAQEMAENGGLDDSADEDNEEVNLL